MADTANPSKIKWGMSAGMGNGSPQITTTAPGAYTGSNQLSGELGFFAEKRLSKWFHLNGALEFDVSTRIAFGNKGSTSRSVLIGAGATIGNVDNVKSFFVSFLIGHSKLDIGDTGDPNAEREGCGFICFVTYDDRLGASASGLGYRVSVGRVMSEKTRLYLSHTHVGGDADDLPDGPTATMGFTKLTASMFF